MGICLGKTASGATTSLPCWPDLPSEIAGLVLARLESHDRLSFAAVCREWRLVAQLHHTLLPPGLACINLGGGAYQSISNSKVGQFANPIHGHLDASFGSYLVSTREGSGQRFICDPFSPSMTSIEIPCRYKHRRGLCTIRDPLSPTTRKGDLGHCHLVMLIMISRLKKIIVLSPHLIVMIFKAHTSKAAPTNFAWFRLGGPGWSDPDTMSGLAGHDGEYYLYEDIEVHREKIFAVGWRGHLFSHEVLAGEVPSLGCAQHVIKEPPDAAVYPIANYHLVESCDKRKLLLVRWRLPPLNTGNKTDHHTMSLRVFEADLDHGRWLEVKDLGNQVLFVGTAGSRAFTVACQSDQQHRRLRGGNRVFLLSNCREWEVMMASVALCKCSDCKSLSNSIPTYCVYDLTSRKASLVSLGSVKHPRSEWFFPSV